MDQRVSAIVGLGNPGAQYSGTRHNVGFEVLGLMADRGGTAFKRSWRFRARSCTIQVSDQDILLVQPQSYMNRSGITVSALRRRRGWDPEQILVIVDDVDLPVGRIRIRAKGGAGGHNGLKSIIGGLGSEAFPRIRVGVGGRERGENLVGHVLGSFAPGERKILDDAVKRAADAAAVLIEQGVGTAMNEFNRNQASDNE
jgi:PTH1 family peptidyl-tRNA hydrolase